MSSSLAPSDDTSSATAPQPKFAQIYIFDTDNKLGNRMNFAEEQQEGIQDARRIFKSQGTPDPRRYNDSTASEIGVLIVGGADNPDMEPSNRDVVVRLKGPDDSLIRINEIHQHYDPLHYIFMFPAGDPGWYCDIKSYNPEAMSTDDGDSDSENGDSYVTIMQYYSSRLMIRQGADANLPKNQQVGLHSFGKLFRQYIVDMFAKMEQQRLNFIRYNQKSLRAAVYNGLRDAIHLDDHDMSSIGKQDAMALVRRFGKPDLFITFTCNPAWDKITRELLQGQTANDRPDLSARVFNLKMRALLDDIIIKTKVFGKVVAYVYPIEFQKHGLPHGYMLFILDHPDKPATVEDVYQIVHAEIPDPVTHSPAYNTNTTCMIHGLCGLLNPDFRGMKNGKCTKNYPYTFNDTTVFDPSDQQHSAISYRRRNIPGRTILRNSGTITVCSEIRV
ncbi:hypothetical protein G6F42_018552 [Rhizopus arrhizus]|nr:hypothetical protein G6F42_018552 [Rhizopus arrhizus]